MLSILAEESRLQSHRQTDQFPGEIILVDGVVAEVEFSSASWRRCAKEVIGGSVLAFQRDPVGPNGERQVSISHSRNSRNICSHNAYPPGAPAFVQTLCQESHSSVYFQF